MLEKIIKNLSQNILLNLNFVSFPAMNAHEKGAYGLIYNMTFTKVKPLTYIQEHILVLSMDISSVPYLFPFPELSIGKVSCYRTDQFENTPYDPL